MLYKVEDNKKFKQQNLSNWKNNSEFWMQSKMRHLQDIYDFTGEEIKQLVGHYSFTPELLDFGCGEGWILRLLKEKLIKANYTGLDFNPQFIDNLASQYKSDSTASFSLTDFEEKPAKKLLGKGDIGINVFNFLKFLILMLLFQMLLVC